MDVEKRLKEAEQEFQKLIVERDALDRRINGLAHVIEGLKSMSQVSVNGIPILVVPESNSIEEIGFTKAVLNYIEFAPNPVFPPEIRDAFLDSPIYASGMRPVPTNLLTTIHSILGRLEKDGKIERTDRDGKTAYRRVSVLKRAVLRQEEMNKTEAARRAQTQKVFGHGFRPNEPWKPIKK